MRIIWRFMRYPLRYRWRLASVYVFMVGNVAGQWLLPVLLGTAVDDALTSGLGSDQLQLGAIILGVAVSKAGFSFGASYIQQIIIARVQEDIRNDIFRKLLGLSFSFYDRNRTGDLMSRAMNDARSVGDTVPASTHRFIATALLLVAIGTFVLVTNWHLGLVVIAFVVLYMWRSFGEGGRLEAIYGRLAERSGNLAAVIQENISGARAVKAFGAGDYEESKFAAEASAVAREGFAADKVSNIQAALLMTIMTVTTGAVLWFGGREVIAGRLTAGELTTFLLYIVLLRAPVGGIVTHVLGVRRVIVGGRRILEVLDAETSVPDRPGPAPGLWSGCVATSSSRQSP